MNAWGHRRARQPRCQHSLLRALQTLLHVTIGLLVAATHAGAQDADNDLNAFIQQFNCTIVEEFKRIHERGTLSKSLNRYLIVAFEDDPQRFAQCIFFEFDTKLLCEASSGRYGPKPGDPDALEISRSADADLKALGYSAPNGVANYTQEIALNTRPDFEDAAALLLKTMYQVYGATEDTRLEMNAPIVGPKKVELTHCKPVS